ncbi:MAG: hypothetical protein Q9191_003576 [Dirinaria sp. TL-2023a]
MTDQSSNAEEAADNCSSQDHRMQETSTALMMDSKNQHGEELEKNEQDASASEEPNKSGTAINSESSPVSGNSNVSDIGYDQELSTTSRRLSVDKVVPSSDDSERRDVSHRESQDSPINAVPAHDDSERGIMRRRESHMETESINEENDANTQNSGRFGQVERDTLTIPFRGKSITPIEERDANTHTSGRLGQVERETSTIPFRGKSITPMEERDANSQTSRGFGQLERETIAMPFRGKSITPMEERDTNTQASGRLGEVERAPTTIPFGEMVITPPRSSDESVSPTPNIPAPDYITEFFDWDRYCQDYDEDSVDWTGRVDWSGSKKGK